MQSAANLGPAVRLIGGADGLRTAIGAALTAQGMQPADGTASLDILVLVAPDGAMGPIAATTAQEFSNHIGAGLRGAFLGLQSGVAAMRAKGGGGSVVFVAPPAGKDLAFDALEQGLRLLTKAAALELGPERIRVNVVLPGAGVSPLGRACAPADIADAVAFLASERSQFMTGADLVVDGGRKAQ